MSIDAAYSRLGHTLGWRFLTGPKATVSSRVEIAFITLNPGGSSEPSGHPRQSCESGNAYLTETWPGSLPGCAPLQRQVQMLFAALTAKLGDTRTQQQFMDSAVMSAYFIPFRSPSLAALPQQAASIQFAVELWTNILDSWLPRCILTIDNRSFREITDILQARPNVKVIDRLMFPTGWGEIQAEAVRLSGLRNDGAVVIARLPHLSRFQLFGKSLREIKLNVFVEYLAAQISSRLEPRPKKGHAMHPCEKIVAAAKYLESQGLTQAQLSRMHHDSLKGRSVTFSTAYKYFGEPKELQERNLNYGNRLVFVADQHKSKQTPISDLIGSALLKWPLR